MAFVGQSFSNAFSLLRNGVLVLVGLLVVSLLLRRYFQSRRGAGVCRGWPATTGQVLHSSVQRRRKIGNKTAAYPAVVYRYEVQGASFQSDRIFPGLAAGGDWFAARKVSQYPAGKAVTVYFNPLNPAESVLEKRAPANVFLLLLVAVVLFFFLQAIFGFSFGLWR